MQLSTRLSAVAELAIGARRLADIGTDHAYVPIYLALYKNLDRALAMDINPGPLQRAQEHIRQYHLEDRIQTRLSDGAAKLRPGEADTAVIAGMGGALTIRILTEGQKNLESVETLVLQPQSEVEDVRRFLHRQGYCILRENMVKDEGKYYPMMLVRRGAQEMWTDAEYRYGRHLIREKNAVLREYLQKEEQTYRKIFAGLEGKTGDHIARRRQELTEMLEQIGAAERSLGM